MELSTAYLPFGFEGREDVAQLIDRIIKLFLFRYL